MSDPGELCAFCGEFLDKGLTKLTEKGCETINNVSLQRGCGVITNVNQRVHEKCRKDFCHPFYIHRDLKRKTEADSVKPPAKLRSRVKFNFQDDCLFCGQPVDSFPKEKYSFVKTLEFQATLKDLCKRRNDSWGHDIYGRIQAVSDLHAADAVYHQSCSGNFRTGRSIPKKFCVERREGPSNLGRPQEHRPEFFKVLKFLEEQNDDLVTISDLVCKMQDLCGENAYSVVWMKQLLLDHYGEDIVIAEVEGKSDVITFRKTASSILHHFYKRRMNQSQEEEEKMRLVVAAAEIIRSEILELKSLRNSYPSTDDIADAKKNLSYVPKCLQELLSVILKGQRSDIKVAAIGQSVVQCTRPRSQLCPLQLGLGVQVHHVYASRFLIDTLHGLGFSVSYSEVLKFEGSAALQKYNETYDLDNGTFMQYVADNVDHNIDTLDGKNTFHGMGMIACLTPSKIGSGTFGRIIQRIDTKPEDIANLCHVRTEFYVSSNGSGKMQFGKLESLKSKCIDMKVDVLCKLVRPLKSPFPSWSGTMQMIQQGEYPGKTNIDFLPIIDMPPTDQSCIYSTLKFILHEASKYNRTAVITFDQPLYWKSVLIRNDSNMKDLVIRLGGFHTQMSFLGSIGHIMSGSGIKALLEVVYAGSSVNHILSGKAVSRALRGYMLADSALSMLLHEIAFGHEGHADEDIQTALQDVADLHEAIMQGETTIDHIAGNTSFKLLEQTLAKTTDELRVSRTAKLWLNFMEMVGLLKKFIIAERKGEWDLHLDTVQEMLPYFAASGHNLYAKSAYIYVNEMRQLETTHPDVHAYFKKGHHVVRRSDRLWAGLSTDLAIEQVLMRSIKSSGGLTRGRGMGESQIAVWLYSMPATSEINCAMQNATESKYQTSEQHVESTKSRVMRDSEDTGYFLNFLKEHSPFIEDPNLRNIETGEVGDKASNCDEAKMVGEQIIKKMKNSSVVDYSFKRREQIVGMSPKSEDAKQELTPTIDPQLMFQRLIIAGDDSLYDSPELFSFELSIVPSSLFDDNGLLREAAKASLAEGIWNKETCAVTGDLNENAGMKYVLDGGALLQRIPWAQGNTFRQICDSYVSHVKRNYIKENVVVVFDSYPDTPSTKDIAHQRRSKGKSSRDILFTPDMPCKVKKENFMSNRRNKQSLIDLLVKAMRDDNITVLQADGDADTLIAQTALQLSESQPITVIAEDTDILVLLLFGASESLNKIIFRSDKHILGKFPKQWDILKTAESLGEELCKVLPVLHAITGCDTTSRLFGIGKGVALKKCMTDSLFRQHCMAFTHKNAKHDTISNAEEELISSLYGGLSLEGLQVLRWRKFTTKTIANRSEAVAVQSLPPSPGAAKHHSFRAYHQCQVWMNNVELKPEEWGWMIENEKLVPVKTTKLPAPQELLKVIRCSCKFGCDSKRCSCRRNGLDCTVACSECRGVSCSNCSALCGDEISEAD